MTGKFATFIRQQTGRLGVFEWSMIAVIVAVVASVTIPLALGLGRPTSPPTAEKKAHQIVKVSNRLAALGVSHVLPESLGGAEATIRLLQNRVRNQAPGSLDMTLPEFGEGEIAAVAAYLQVLVGEEKLLLKFAPDST